VAELVDALDSKSSFFGSAGSIPALSTLIVVNHLIFNGFLFLATSSCQLFANHFNKATQKLVNQSFFMVLKTTSI
jgi:hypothetical protein